MDFSIPFKICSSGLAAQRAKMDVISSNLAWFSLFLISSDFPSGIVRISGSPLVINTSG